jgi:ubiquinone/menaquinone biosynthesis C-methylase UbiE
MAVRVCPWWLAYTFDNPLRRLVHNPGKILSPYLEEGMTVLDTGCGMGFFSIAMAHLVGSGGKVIAVDVQLQILEVLKKRAEKAGVSERIVTVCCEQNKLSVSKKADFALAFYMVHEVPDKGILFRQVISCLKPGARFFLVEPWVHVSRSAFKRTVEIARAAGLVSTGSARVRFSYAQLFTSP